MRTAALLIVLCGCTSLLERPVQAAEGVMERRIRQLEAGFSREIANVDAALEQRVDQVLEGLDHQRTETLADVDARLDRQRRETLSAISAQRTDFQSWAASQREATQEWAAVQREQVQAWATEQREALQAFLSAELDRVPDLARESSTGATTGVLSSIGLRKRADGSWDVTTFLLLLGAVGGGFSIVKSAWRRATGRAFVREQKTSNVALPPTGTVFAHVPPPQPQPTAQAVTAGATP